MTVVTPNVKRSPGRPRKEPAPESEAVIEIPPEIQRAASDLSRKAIESFQRAGTDSKKLETARGRLARKLAAWGADLLRSPRSKKVD